MVRIKNDWSLLDLKRIKNILRKGIQNKLNNDEKLNSRISESGRPHVYIQNIEEEES